MVAQRVEQQRTRRVAAVAAHLQVHVPVHAKIRSCIHVHVHSPADDADSCLLGLRPRAVLPQDIIFGCSPIGPRYMNMQGGISKDTRATLTATDSAAPAIHAALSAGIRYFDTAPLYGDCEDRLGEALASSPLGSQAIVITKCGKLIRRLCGNRHVASAPPRPFLPFSIPINERVLMNDYTARGAQLSLNESRERLGGRKVHTLRMHDVDGDEGAFEAATGPSGMLEGMRQLREAGEIVEVSFGMNANNEHKTITPGSGGLSLTPWDPSAIVDLLRAAGPGTFDSALLACATASAHPHAQTISHTDIGPASPERVGHIEWVARALCLAQVFVESVLTRRLASLAGVCSTGYPRAQRRDLERSVVCIRCPWAVRSA